ncbi:MAG: 5'-nucleotidase C-terminal domain-containing protein [Paracoccaceae bacterium]
MFMNTEGESARINADLRILATSDVHMHLSGHDDLRNRPSLNSGLARLAPLIAQQRENAQGAVVLFDNGDTLQGTSLGATAAKNGVNADHPLLQTMHLLGYSAMGVGNHDFDFGMEYLNRFAEAAQFPVLCGNLQSKGKTSMEAGTLVDLEVSCSDAQTRPLKIGVVSGLPRQTEHWAGDRLGKNVTFSDPVEAMCDEARRLRLKGASIVVALCHSGFDDTSDKAGLENFGLLLADTQDFDAIIAGHTHQCLPGPHLQGVKDVDSVNGTVKGVPAVMPGYAASHLGCIDLKLTLSTQGVWEIVSAKSELFAACGQPAEPEINQAIKSAQRLTDMRLNEVVGETDVHLHSYFSLLCPDPALGLLSQAFLHGLDQCDIPPDLAQLPRLAVVAPGLSGGRSGPDHYVDVPPGQIPRRAIDMLCPFEDRLCGVVLTGQQIMEWLERSAIVFNQMDGYAPLPRLTQNGLPGFNFDMFLGLSVVIDPRQPARYGVNGQIVDPTARRISSIKWNRSEIDPKQRFLVAMSNYRANGGGKFLSPVGRGADVVSDITLKQTIVNLLRRGNWKGHVLADWHLHPKIGHKAIFETAPNAVSHLSQIDHFEPAPLNETTDGFLRVQVSL